MKSNHLQKYIKVLQRNHFLCKKSPKARQNVSDQNRENASISNKQSNAEIHLYAKPYTTTKPPVKKPSTSNTCKSQKYNTICTEISSLMKTYSSDKQEKLEENEKEVLLKSCLNDTTDKIASNILSIECIKKNIIHHLSQESRQTAQHMNRGKHFYVSQLMEKKIENLKDINWYSIVEEL